MKFLPLLALMFFLALLLFAPAGPALALDLPVPGSNPADDITGSLDAMPVHLGVPLLPILVIEILKRLKFLKSNRTTWVARALGGMLWFMTVVLPTDTLANVMPILATVVSFGWSIFGSEKLYDFWQAVLGAKNDKSL